MRASRKHGAGSLGVGSAWRAEMMQPGPVASRSRRIWCRHSLVRGDRFSRGMGNGQQEDLAMYQRVFGPARPAARAFAVATATTLFSALIGAAALAQTPPAPPAAPAPKAPKAAPKAQAPKPAEAPAAQAQAPAAPAPGAADPQLIFSPWTKFCLKGQEANAKQVCFTGKDGRVESGMPVVAAVLIEPEGEPKKVLRVTLPLGMSIQPGTRVIVDNGQPMTGPYVICFA